MIPTKEQAETRYKNFLSKSNFRRNQAVIGIGLLFGFFVLLLTLVTAVQDYELEIYQNLEEESITAEPKLEPIPVCGPGTILENVVCVTEKVKHLPIENRLYSILTLVITLVLAILGMYFIFKAGTEIFDRQQKIFFEFFHTYVILQNFVDVKGNSERNKARKRINGLIYFFESWVGDEAPNSIYELPNSIKENLNKKLLPLINNKKIKEITEINKNFQEFAYLVYDEGPNENELRKFNGILNSIQTISKEKPSKVIKKIEFYENAKAIVVSIIFTIVLGSLLTFSELDWGEIILGSTAIGAMIFLGMRKKII